MKDPDDADDLFKLSGLSRRDFLRVCGVASAGLLLGTSCASTTTSSTTGAGIAPAPTPSTGRVQAAAPPAPRDNTAQRLPLFDSSGVEPSGFGAACGGGSHNTAGDLEAHIDLDVGSDAGSFGSIRSFVRWNFTYTGQQPAMATVAVDYTFTPGTIDCYAHAAGSDTGVLASDAKAYVQLGVDVFDNTQDGHVNLLIEQRGEGQPSFFSLTLDGTYKGQQQPVTFKPGHSYRIEAYIVAAAYLWPDGRSQAQVTGTIKGMTLVPLQPPWITTRLVSASANDADTWDALEGALALQGRHYYVGAARLKVSAGGNFNYGYVDVGTMWPESEITGISGTTLPITLNAGGAPNSARIMLPPASSLPLEGNTWQFVVKFDPQYHNPWDDLVKPEVPIMPLVAPVFGMWGETSQAAAEVVAAQRQDPSYRLASLQMAAGGAQQVQPTEFFDLANYSVVLPLSRFLALSQPTLKTLPKGARTLPVLVYTPPRASPPRLNSNLLTVKAVSTPPAGTTGLELSTEPVVIISLLDLWQQYLDMPHLLLEAKGLEWCANPHFIRLLTQVGESDAAFREYLAGLAWMPRAGGPAINLVDLPEYVKRRIGEVSPEYPLWMVIAGVTVAVIIVFSPRLRRWVRRIFTIDQAQLWLDANRPAQDQAISAYGHASNAGGQQAEAPAQTPNRVFFDYVPQRYNQGGVPLDLP